MLLCPTPQFVYVELIVILCRWDGTVSVLLIPVGGDSLIPVMVDPLIPGVSG